jgi:hypothetical protein
VKITIKNLDVEVEGEITALSQEEAKRAARSCREFIFGVLGAPLIVKQAPADSRVNALSSEELTRKIVEILDGAELDWSQCNRIRGCAEVCRTRWEVNRVGRK